MAKKLTPEAAAKEYIHLKTDMKCLEKRIEELKAVIEPALREAPEQSAEWHGWKFKLVESSRDSFSLSKAREKIDGRILAPYITTAQVVQIRTTWAGGEEAAAA